ncbi:hypothetical protein NFC81_01675 [Salinispirillum sp. LH 10-3-1]|uniref:Uncharacterized protein n=1 Tax=Salinispirillum sp. LH 10-3-1 TaxID=2952525 RepID=A0AB38YGL0_9GAMM
MKKLILKLHDSSPDRLTMKRLGQYLPHLADLLGESEHVHFTSVTDGSAMLNVAIEESCYPKIIEQVRLVHGGKGSKKSQKAYSALQNLMDEDGTGGAILDNAESSVLMFRKSQHAEKPLLVTKSGSVQGRLYKIGGKDATIPVRLEGANGETLHCEATVEIAEKLSAHLFKQVRVSGHGQWARTVEGRWSLRKLTIESFDVLKTANAGAVIAQLQSIGGLKWSEMDDPHGMAKDLRS